MKEELKEFINGLNENQILYSYTLLSKLFGDQQKGNHVTGEVK